MKLYKLSVIGYVDWDSYRSFVIRAKSAHAARTLAAEQSGLSGLDTRWLCPKVTSCNVIKSDGKPAIVLSDYKGG